MKAEKLEIKMKFFPLRSGFLLGPDALNNTKLFIDGQKVWPEEPGDDPFSPASISPGNTVSLEIPSGRLHFVVDDVERMDGQVSVFSDNAGTWEGRAGGLANGLSGCCDFEVLDLRAMVTRSSTLPEGEAVPYWVYEDVRSASSFTRDKQDVMARIFAILLDEKGDYGN